MGKRTVLLAIALVAMLGIVAPASATQMVTFDLNNAFLDFDVVPNTLVVTESLGSIFDVKLENDAMSTNIRDTARIDGGGDFDFALSLTLTDLPGVDNWSAAGTFVFTDTNTASNAVEANFTSTDMSIWDMGMAGKVLLIQGVLTKQGGNPAILVNRGDPWVYVGESAIAGELDSDGTAGQITVPNPDNWDIGTLWTLKFGVATASLDVLFGQDQEIQGGEVKGTITPVPAALPLGVLGFAGLVVLGRKMRKLA